MVNEEKEYEVTFLHGRKFHYAMPIFLLVCSFYAGFKIFVNISILYLILFVICFSPILLISLKSRIKKYKLEVTNEKIMIGPVTLNKDSLQKIVVYQPITIYFHMEKKKEIEAIQCKKEDAEYVVMEVMKWASINEVKIERNY